MEAVVGARGVGGRRVGKGAVGVPLAVGCCGFEQRYRPVMPASAEQPAGRPEQPPVSLKVLL